MYPTQEPPAAPPLHEQVLRDARAAKRALDGVIRPIAAGKDPAAVHTPEYWDEVWKTAHYLRLKADALGVRAQKQGRLLREAAHPANQPSEPWDSLDPRDDQ